MNYSFFLSLKRDKIKQCDTGPCWSVSRECANSSIDLILVDSIDSILVDAQTKYVLKMHSI